MRAITKLLTVVAVLAGLLVPAPAQAAAPQCPAGEICSDLNIEPNHICYLPRPYSTSTCPVPVEVVDPRYTPPRSIPAPGTISLRYDVLPVDGSPRGFVPVQGARMTIPAGATGGAVPVQLRPDSPLPEERVRVEIYNPSIGSVLNGVSTVVIRAG